MKKLLIFLLLFLTLGFWGVKAVSAQTSNEVTVKYGITFPISELGNCENITSCKTYCDDPINSQSCVSYAKSKGFYKEEEIKTTTLVQKAKEVLGCDSQVSCKSLCEKEENFDKCHSFAQSNGVVGGYKEDPSKGEVLTKAKESLGCTSYETCKGFCDNPANYDKCAQFAQSVGVRGGYEYRGPGGCTTEETCRTFCQDPANTETCRQFSQRRGSQNDYDPQTECRKYTGCSWSGTYCQCNNQGQNEPGVERQKVQCNSYPGCSWDGNSCQCGGGPQNRDSMSRENQEEGCRAGGGTCKWNGDICNCQGYDQNKDTRPEVVCARSGNGCYWNGASCKCDRSGGPSPSPSYGDYSKGDYSCGQAALAVGCYTTAEKTCKCPQTNYRTPSPTGGTSYGDASKGDYSCGQAALAVGCYTVDKTCKCPSGGSSGGGNMMSRESQEAGCRSGGGTCNWNGDMCNCQGYRSTQTSQPAQTSQPVQTQAPQQAQPDPATQCSSYPGCSWNGSSCQCSSPAVQGVHTVATWAQEAFYFFINTLKK